MKADVSRMLRVTRAQVAAMQKSFQIAVDAAKTIRRTCVSATVRPPLPPQPLPSSAPAHAQLQEQTLLPPTCQAVDYCQWPLESCAPERLKWRQQQHARVPALPSVFAPPGFLIERISLKPVGYGKTGRCRHGGLFTMFDTHTLCSGVCVCEEERLPAAGRGGCRCASQA